MSVTLTEEIKPGATFICIDVVLQGRRIYFVIDNFKHYLLVDMNVLVINWQRIYN